MNLKMFAKTVTMLRTIHTTMNKTMFDNVNETKETQRFKKVHPMMATSSEVCSFCLYYIKNV